MIFGNMGEMIKMAKEMQGQVKKMKDELSRETFEGSDSGVVIKISGDMDVREVKISPALVDPTNVSRLERAVKEATAKALSGAKDGASRKMKSATGGLGLPPGMF